MTRSSPHTRLTSSFNWQLKNPPIIHPVNNSTLNIRKFEGNDCRFNGTEEPFDVTLFRQYALMQHLERKNIDNVKKIEYMNHNSFLFNISLAYNLMAGGLMDDYNFPEF